MPGYPRGMGQPPPGGFGDWRGELAQIHQRLNGLSASSRRSEESYAEIKQHLSDLSKVLEAVTVSRIGGPESGPEYPGILRIQDVPGRRVPFDVLVEIPINANDAQARQGSITISQTGPFVAVARYVTFLSEFQAQRIDPQTQEAATFLGRSNGRFRPPHSAWDLLDAQLPADTVRTIAMPGTGAPSYASPSSHSPYRSMEFDGRILLKNQGSGYPRSNIAVPTTFWTTQINSAFPLGCLDWFARSEIIEIDVTPTHINNQPGGNISGIGAGGVFPFLQAQFDHHEGIDDTEDLTVVDGDPDPVQRLPAGRLIVGMHGYRIIQPPGVVTDLKGV